MRPSLLVLVFALAACVPAAPSGTEVDDLTSVGGRARQIDWDAFVTVAPDADDATIARTVQRQVKSALGALRARGVGIADRDALGNLDPADWRREPLTVVDAAGAPQGATLRVRYHYRDTALVDKSKAVRTDLPLTLLFGDYTQAVAALAPACVDEPTDGDSLWYHFAPDQPACAQKIAAETDAVNRALAHLSDGQIAAAAVARRFLPVRARLTTLAVAPTRYPEYDRLWGRGSDRQKLVLYAFVGVEHDLGDSHDAGAVEYQRMLRTLRAARPELAVSYTAPFAWLLDFTVDGQPLATPAGLDDVARWMVDDAGYPPEVAGDAAKIEALRQQVIARFAERWIYLTMPVRVTVGGETRDMTVEIRTYWGREDGSPEARQQATWRYLEAFWHGDVFAYSGHSHFGHGPLEPTNYRRENFPARYQVLLINSCLSYNYYDLDFLQLHPNGSRDLDVVVNALPAYWHGMGASQARYLLALTDGAGRSWAQLLESMKVDDPWGRPGYEPMRAVNGELDNAYDPARLPLSVSPR